MFLCFSSCLCQEPFCKHNNYIFYEHSSFWYSVCQQGAWCLEETAAISGFQQFLKRRSFQLCVLLVVILGCTSSWTRSSRNFLWACRFTANSVCLIKYKHIALTMQSSSKRKKTFFHHFVDFRPTE